MPPPRALGASSAGASKILAATRRLATAVPLFGSAVLGLALEQAALSGDEAFDLSRLDEAFQEDQWGVDEEAAQRTDARRAEARLLERWFAALR